MKFSKTFILDSKIIEPKIHGVKHVCVKVQGFKVIFREFFLFLKSY